MPSRKPGKKHESLEVRLEVQYAADYPEGTLVKIAARQDLEKFRSEWRLHDPIQPEQLQYADQIGRVRRVGYYHGGDVLYWLEDIPGTWHECCLRAAAAG